MVLAGRNVKRRRGFPPFPSEWIPLLIPERPSYGSKASCIQMKLHGGYFGTLLSLRTGLQLQAHACYRGVRFMFLGPSATDEKNTGVGFGCVTATLQEVLQW